ncbi:hypothetical protein U2U65_003522 [Vibrio cholerae]|nr:hypothetical protein [Vibrio cholerae]
MKKWFLFWKKTKEVNAGIKVRSDLDIALSQMKRNINISDAHYEAIYIPILKRTTAVLAISGQKDKIKPLYVALNNMLRQRRGKILPVGILPEKVQKYREISTLTIVVAACAKVLSYYNVRNSIESVEFGHQHFFPAIFDFVIQGKREGIHKAQFAVIGPKAELLFGQWVCYDLLVRSPQALKWYGMFPDVFYMLMQCVAGNDKTIMGDLVETYVSRALEGNLVVEEEEVLVPINASSPIASSPEPITNSRDKERVVGELFKNIAKNKEGDLSQNSSIETSVSAPVASVQSQAMSKLMGFLSAAQSEAPTSEPVSSNASSDAETSAEDLPVSDALVEQYFDLLNSDYKAECFVKNTESGEQLIIVTVAMHRDICTRLFKNLAKLEKKSVELDFITCLKTFENEPLATPRLNYQISQLSTEKYIVFKFDLVKNRFPSFGILSSGLITDLGL